MTYFARNLFHAPRVMGLVRYFSGHGAEISVAPAVNGVSKARDRIINITFTDVDNNKTHVEGLIGETLLTCAMRNDIKFFDVCLGLSDPTDVFNIGLQCCNCHVHLGNDYVKISKELNPIVEGEQEQLDYCNVLRSDISAKYGDDV